MRHLPRKPPPACGTSIVRCAGPDACATFRANHHPHVAQASFLRGGWGEGGGGGRRGGRPPWRDPFFFAGRGLRSAPAPGGSRAPPPPASGRGSICGRSFFTPWRSPGWTPAARQKRRILRRWPRPDRRRRHGGRRGGCSPAHRKAALADRFVLAEGAWTPARHGSLRRQKQQRVRATVNAGTSRPAGCCRRHCRCSGGGAGGGGGRSRSGPPALRARGRAIFPPHREPPRIRGAAAGPAGRGLRGNATPDRRQRGARDQQEISIPIPT